MQHLKNKVILITGGSGFLGNALARRIKCKELRIFSRAELKQEIMREKFPHLKYILGDIRNYESIRDAVRGVDIVIHAAAAKRVDWSEEQPADCARTNVFGSMNVIRACIEEGVKQCVGCSTDKVPYAVNVYGCTKRIMESLFHEANQYKETLFTIVRYGNVIGSTGSVIPKWQKARQEGKPIIVTNREMVRFFMTVDQSVDLILKSIKEGRDVIPRDLKAINMWKLAEIVSQGKVPLIEVGKRAGERNFEVLIPDYEGEEFSTKTAQRYTKEEIEKLI